MIITIREAIQQHSAVVESLVASNFLWCPQIIDFVHTTSELYKCTIIRLNDGRECQVLTQLYEIPDGVRVETGASKWETTERT